MPAHAPTTDHQLAFIRAGLDEDGRYPVSPDYYDHLGYADRPYASMPVAP